jgi:hypothetical protein
MVSWFVVGRDPPTEITHRWEQYRSQLPGMSEIKLKRHLLTGQHLSCELHGFCDASEMGYAAAVYLRVVDVNGDVSISLVMAKSKVAPLKRRSLPQLELCGAHLLAKLLSYVSSLYVKCNIIVVTAWTDSMIVLGWLRASPHRWKTFVSNRVAYIQDKVPSECWRHVRSSDNPADCASRGLLPDEVKNHNLWWRGPNWLHQDPDFWPTEPSTASVPEEAIINSETRRTILLIATVVKDQSHHSASSSFRSQLPCCVKFESSFRTNFARRTNHRDERLDQTYATFGL